MNKETKSQNDIRLHMLKLYFEAVGVEHVSPNLVAEVCYDKFPFWNLTGDDIVYLSDNL